MAEPLFIDRDKLLERQRLSSISDTSDVSSQVDLSIETTRTEFWTRLGLVKLDALVALTLDGDPSTDLEYKKLLAQVTELKMVRAFLLRHLNTITRQGGGARTFQEWNEVAAFRGTTAQQRSDEIERCQMEIEQAFGILSDENLAGNSPSVRADTIRNKLKDEHRVVGFSLYASTRYLFCFSLDTSNE